MTAIATSARPLDLTVEKSTFAQFLHSYRLYRADRRELRALLNHDDQMLDDVGVSRTELRHLLGLGFRAYRARFGT